VIHTPDEDKASAYQLKALALKVSFIQQQVDDYEKTRKTDQREEKR
jgi:hypothetical protein